MHFSGRVLEDGWRRCRELVGHTTDGRRRVLVTGDPFEGIPTRLGLSRERGARCTDQPMQSSPQGVAPCVAVIGNERLRAGGEPKGEVIGTFCATGHGVERDLDRPRHCRAQLACEMIEHAGQVLRFEQVRLAHEHLTRDASSEESCYKRHIFAANRRARRDQYQAEIAPREPRERLRGTDASQGTHPRSVEPPHPVSDGGQRDVHCSDVQHVLPIALLGHEASDLRDGNPLGCAALKANHRAFIPSTNPDGHSGHRCDADGEHGAPHKAVDQRRLARTHSAEHADVERRGDRPIGRRGDERPQLDEPASRAHPLDCLQYRARRLRQRGQPIR